MQLLINNKSPLDCTEDDFHVLLNNPDFRENQYLDYKKDFAFRKVPKENKEKIAEEIAEFRSDICAFANADGGYLIYGISEKEALAQDLIGVEIENPDKFELELRNKLNPIMPKIPPVQIKFTKLEIGKYIVVVKVEHDYYSPYIHVEQEKDYRIYKRDGNQKTCIGYTELKNMFIQSRGLEDEILQFRKERINYFEEQHCAEHGRFLLVHIVPESFQTNRERLLIIEKTKSVSFGSVFYQSRVSSNSIPCVDGLRFANYEEHIEGILYNNGIAELCVPLSRYVFEKSEGLFFAQEEVWRYIDGLVQGYHDSIPEIFGNGRYFACISIVGCKNVMTEWNIWGHYTNIDRDRIICSPVVFENLQNKEYYYRDFKLLHIEYLLSLGLKHDKVIEEYINNLN